VDDVQRVVGNLDRPRVLGWLGRDLEDEDAGARAGGPIGGLRASAVQGSDDQLGAIVAIDVGPADTVDGRLGGDVGDAARVRDPVEGAAAGGVGQILCQWAKGLGAFVIGTASSPEKCALAQQAGADIAINYSHEDWPQALLAATGGKKANVVYDSVGKDTFLKSLDCAAQFGLVVIYGAASGPAPAIEPELLNKKGCLFLTRPSVFPHNADPAVFRENAADLFAAIAAGIVKAHIGASFKLADIVAVHQAAESRATQGATLITP